MEKIKRRKFLAWFIAICIMLPLAMPVLVFADSGRWSIESGDSKFNMEITPYSNEVGLMVNAEDAAKAFSLDYDFDIENKAFTITDDIHGKVVLMHNATQFLSGDKTYDCTPFFFVENTVPMVELGIFCNMFASSYETKGNDIVIKKDVLNDRVAKINNGDTTVPLYMEPFVTELGLMVCLEDISRAFGVGCSINSEDNSATLTDELKGTIILGDRAEKFVSDAGEFECEPYYYVENGIAYVETGFFCNMFGSSYDYDKDTKVITIKEGAPSTGDRKTVSTMSEGISLMSTSLSGRILYPGGAPTDGLDVKLILQQVDERYYLYKGYQNYAGNTYVIGTVHLNCGETSKSYSFDVSKYYSYQYSKFCLCVEEEKAGIYAFCNNNDSLTKLSYSPMNLTNVISSAKSFGYTSNIVDIDLDSGISKISGNISLGNDGIAPTGGIDVDLILQTRSQIYSRESIYGGSYDYYLAGKTVKLGTVHFNEGENTRPYTFAVSDYYTDSSYPYFSLFYQSENNDCVEPYGYINTRGEITSIPQSPFAYKDELTYAKTFVLWGISSADIVLPLKPAYYGDKIKIGDYLQMGTYYGKPILWRCVDIDENGPLMLSDRILCLKAFDASGNNISGSHQRGYDSGSYRKSNGSNYWADSNIRCWLNSRAGAGNVSWACGNPPDNSHVYDGYNEYDQEAGFLTNFTNSELAAIKTVTQDSLLDRYEYSDMSPYGTTYHAYNSPISAVAHNAKTTAYREQVIDSMFLLDVNQINKVYQNDGLLGENKYYMGIPTAEAVANSEFKYSSLNATARWWSWLRSPSANDYYGSGYVRYVYSDGSVYSLKAYDGYGGVRPAFYLNPASDLSGLGSEAEPYEIESGSVTGVSLSEQSREIYKGNSFSLTPTVLPANATNKNVTWKSSNSGIATVTNGYVTGVSAGTATITVTTADGGYTATCTVTVKEQDENAPKVTISNIKAKKGNQVEVTVDLSNNTGFSNLAIEVGYNDSVMTLDNAVSTVAGASLTTAQNITANPYNMQWDNASDVTYNGTLATLTFTVKDNAPDGVYPITVDFYKGRNGDNVDGEDVNYTANYDALGLVYINGGLTVFSYIPGDLDGNGRVNNKDATEILRYFANWTLPELVVEALDVDGSGKVNNKDATHLLRYFANWAVELH